MSAQLVSGIFGLTGSIFLGIPAWKSLGDRRAIDEAGQLYEHAKAQAGKKVTPAEQESALRDAWTSYQADRDGVLAMTTGQFSSNWWWNFTGLVCLGLSFAILILDALINGAPS